MQNRISKRQHRQKSRRYFEKVKYWASGRSPGMQTAHYVIGHLVTRLAATASKEMTLIT